MHTRTFARAARPIRHATRAACGLGAGLVMVMVMACRQAGQPSASPVGRSLPDAPIVGRVQLHGPAPLRESGDGRGEAIAAVGPRAERAGDTVGITVPPYVYFARPMEPDAAALHFEFDPPVAGETVWIDPYRAVFQPEALELGRHYRARVHGTVRREGGTAVHVDERWTFDTRPPTLSLEIDDDTPMVWDDDAHEDGPRTHHWRVGLRVESEEHFVAADLARHVRARAWPVATDQAAARPVKLRVIADDRARPKSGPSRFAVIRPEGRWPADHIVEVTVDGAFAPRFAGPLGAEVRTRFRVAPGAEAKITCAEDFGDGCGPGGLYVEFSSPMDERELARIRVSPRPAAGAVRVFGDRLVSLDGDFVIGRTYDVAFPRALRDRMGQPLRGPKRRKVAFVQPPPSIELVNDRGVLRPSAPATVGLESRWIGRAKLRAAVPSERAWSALQGRDLAEVAFPTDVSHTADRVIDLAPSGRYAWSSIALDVASLAGGKRPVFVEVVALDVLDAAAHRPAPQPTRGLFQVTDLGLTVWRSPSGSRVQVRDNTTLLPASGVTVDVVDLEGARVHRVSTDDAGLAVLPSDRALPERAAMVARGDDSVALLEIGEPAPDPEMSWRDRGEDRWITSVLTERRLYRAGETVSAVGWAAISTTRNAHGLLRPKAGAPVVLELLDRHDEVVAHRRVAIKRDGKYWGRLALPDHAAPGRYQVRARLPERGHGLAHMAAAEATVGFEIRDAPIPEFELRTATTLANLVRPQPAEIAAHAGYFFGAPVPITQQRAVTRCAPADLRVPGLGPGWSTLVPERNDSESYWTLDAAALPGAAGELRYRIDTASLPAGLGITCDTDLAVQDASFTEVGASERWYVHPSRHVVARALPRPSGHGVEVRSVTPDGKARVVQAVTVEIAREEEHRDRRGDLVERLVTVRRCTLETTATGDDARCDTPGVLPEGRYVTRITTIIDGRTAALRQRFWISRPRVPRSTTPTSFELEVDRAVAEPGDRVTLTMRAPAVTGPGVLAFSHGGLRRLLPFVLENGTATLALDVTDAWVPEVELDAFVVTPGTDARSPPKTWRDSARVSVGHEHRRLGVSLDAPSSAGPGDAVTIGVRVVDAAGAPVDGRVALWAVDEAVHAMMPPHIPDLVATFARGRSVQGALLETYSHVLRPYTVRDDPFEGGAYTGGGSGYGTGSGGGGGFGGGSGSATQPMRRRFEATPIFVGDAAVEDGRATIRGRMPDNLTTYRITAIASAEVDAGAGVGRFGHTDARIELSAPLVVRPAMPRMLRVGDRAQIAALVDNLGGGDGALSVELVATRGGALLEFVDPPRAKATIGRGEQRRFPFEVVARGVGTVEFELRATLDGETVVRDAMTATLAIEATPLIRRHAATRGSTTAAGPLAIALAQPAARGPVDVDVELNGTMLGDLQGLARDLVRYPYGCVEQTSSGLLPLVGLARLGHGGYLDVDVDAHVAVGIARLRSMQTDDGGLGYWPGARHTHVWGTAYALWVLEALVAGGHEVPAALREGMRDSLLARLGELESDDARVGAEGIDDVAATMAVQALVSAGARPTASVKRLFEARAGLPVFARALLLMAAHGLAPTGEAAKTLAKELRATVVVRGGAASVRPGATVYDEYFDSDARTHAMVLMALQRVAPADPLIEPLAAGLARHRGEGHVANTQERAYTLMALGEYAEHRESEIPAMDAAVWIGQAPTEPVAIAGRTAPTVHRRGSVAKADSDARVTIDRRGAGRLYYRVGMSWTPEQDGNATAGAHGFALSRRLDDAEITAGDLVTMDVAITVDHTSRYVAIEVPLPPGLEAVDTTMGAGGRARTSPRRSAAGVRVPAVERWRPGRPSAWVSHQELRKDRVVIFADALRPGTHHTTVHLRAIAAGRYAMPAAEAHAMYSPELRGNTAGTEVVIRPRP